MAVGTTHYIVLAAALFALGAFGMFWRRRTLIVLLMCLELLLLSANILFVAFAAAAGDLAGQVFVMTILTVAAAEAAIGLAILVVLFRARGSVAVGDIAQLRG
jgi:NADH-quinone oxidoreductase subunit K